MKTTLAVIGDRAAQEIVDLAEQDTDRFHKVVKLYYDPADFSQRASELHSEDSVSYIVGISDTALKRAIVQACERVGWNPVSIIHPSAWIAKTAVVAEGSFVAPCSVVSSQARVGKHSIVHFHASVGHDALVGEYCALLPGARLSGYTKVGSDTVIGSNAFIAQGVEVGSLSRVDALTYVSRSLPAQHIVSVRHPVPVPRVVYDQ